MIETGRTLVQSSPETRSWLQGLRNRLPYFEYSEAKYYAAFRRVSDHRAFAYLNPAKHSIRLFLSLAAGDEIHLQPTPSTSSWAERFPTVFRMTCEQDLPTAARLIAKSYAGVNVNGERVEISLSGVLIDVASQDLSDEVIDLAIREERLRIGIVPTDNVVILARQRRGQERGDEGEKLITSLLWFLFRRWKRVPDDTLEEGIEHCPNQCGHGKIAFRYSDPVEKVCPSCEQPVYLTDVFRLHERIDEEIGAGGILAYVITMLEQLVLVHVFYDILERIKPSLMRNILFIKDGPLSFAGLVAPLSTPMRELIEHLLSQPGGSTGPTVRIAGLEKSGAFVEHAAAIQEQMQPGFYFTVGNEYIRRYIIPGEEVYGRNTYYGQKVFFRAPSGEMHVVTMPARSYLAEPKPTDIPYLDEILTLIAEMRCSMYDNALIPVALANKLVSLSDFPSQRLLGTFAKSVMGGQEGVN